MSDKTERASAYSDASFNCAQAVFAAFADDYDIETEVALRISGGFGGGMRCGELCGALTGGVMVVGAAKGQYLENDSGARENCNAATMAFTAAFRSRYVCITCRELLGVDTSTPEGQAKFVEENMFKTKCSGYIKSAVEILEEQGF